MAKKVAKKKTAKSKCAVALGKKGGRAAVAKKVGVHSPAYKKKVKAKAAAKKKAAPKKKTTRKVTKKKSNQASLF